MMLAMFAGEHKDEWDDLLPPVMMAYRSGVHESTGFSPYRLWATYTPLVPISHHYTGGGGGTHIYAQTRYVPE